MKPILKIEDLVVEYRTREFGQRAKIAVNRLSLEVFPGEVFGFLGPNGAGKTTTMNVLLGFVPATRGAAYVFNVNLRDPIVRQRIGCHRTHESARDHSAVEADRENRFLFIARVGRSGDRLRSGGHPVSGRTQGHRTGLRTGGEIRMQSRASLSESSWVQFRAMNQLVWSATAERRKTRALERSAALPNRTTW